MASASDALAGFGRRNAVQLDKTNHIGYMLARNGCGGRLALRFSPPLDGRCSFDASATLPTDSGSGSHRRLHLRRRSKVLCGLTGRTRARPVAACCRRAEWTVSCDPRPSFATMIAHSRSAGHARPARAPPHRLSPVATFPHGVIPRSPAGGLVCLEETCARKGAKGASLNYTGSYSKPLI